MISDTAFDLFGDIIVVGDDNVYCYCGLDTTSPTHTNMTNMYKLALGDHVEIEQ